MTALSVLYHLNSQNPLWGRCSYCRLLKNGNPEISGPNPWNCKHYLRRKRGLCRCEEKLSLSLSPSSLSWIIQGSPKSYQKCYYKRGTGRWHVQRTRKQSDTAETGVMPPEQGDADGHQQLEETKDGVAPRAFLEGGPASTLISVQWTDIKFLASRTVRAIPVALSNQVCGHLWQPQETHAVIIPVSQMGKKRLRKDNSLRS